MCSQNVDSKKSRARQKLANGNQSLERQLFYNSGQEAMAVKPVVTLSRFV